jgi:hypothetical protein
MSMPPQPAQVHDELGPIDFLALEFPRARLSAPGVEQSRALADHGVIDILDLEFIAKDAAGTARTVDVRELPTAHAVVLSVWAGASSGLLVADAELREIGAAIQPGSVAAVVVYENRWMLRLLDAWEREGPRLITDGGVTATDLIAGLDATEPAHPES